MSARATTILLVEDSPADVLLTREALLQGGFAVDLHIAEHGVEALDFLYRRGKFRGSPRPDLLLLDLNLPRKDGREVLTEMRAEESLREIPVIVFSTSASDEDVRRSYALGANCFVTKPVEFNGFVKVLQTVQQFWLTVATLPRR